MRAFSKFALLSSLSCLGLAFAPSAFAADSLEIRDFIGTINWSNGPMAVDVQENEGDLVISKGRRVTVNGGIEKIDSSDCKSSYGQYDIDWFGKRKKGRYGGYKNLEDFPVLNIALPPNTDLIIRNSVVFTLGEPDVSSADIELPHCGSVDLGRIENTLSLDSRGSADVSVGDIGAVTAHLRGSGDLTGGDTGDVEVKSQGSGDVELGMTGSLDLSLHGSGDFEAYDVDGDADISSHGSGDLELGDIDGSLVYTGHGSGDLEVSSVTGPQLFLKSHGSGDIDIAGGEVDSLRVSVSGSAAVDFSGDAQSANLSASGSGDISVYRVHGSAVVRSSGSGDIDIGQKG